MLFGAITHETRRYPSNLTIGGRSGAPLVTATKTCIGAKDPSCRSSRRWGSQRTQGWQFAHASTEGSQTPGPKLVACWGTIQAMVVTRVRDCGHVLFSLSSTGTSRRCTPPTSRRFRADLRFATATDEFSVEREADLADKLARAGFVAASVVVYEDLLGPQPGSRRVPPSDLNRSKARLADCLRRMGRGQEASAILADLPRPTFAGQGRVVAGVLALVAAALSLCGLFLPWVDEPPGCIPLGQSGIDDLRGDIMLLVGACILIVVAVRILASGDGRLGIVSFAGFVLIVLGSYLRLSAEAVCLGSSAGPSLWLVLAGSAIYVTALITSQVTARSAKRRLETNTRSRDASSSG